MRLRWCHINNMLPRVRKTPHVCYGEAQHNLGTHAQSNLFLSLKCYESRMATNCSRMKERKFAVLSPELTVIHRHMSAFTLQHKPSFHSQKHPPCFLSSSHKFVPSELHYKKECVPFSNAPHKSRIFNTFLFVGKDSVLRSKINTVGCLVAYIRSVRTTVFPLSHAPISNRILLQNRNSGPKSSLCNFWDRGSKVKATSTDSEYKDLSQFVRALIAEEF